MHKEHYDRVSVWLHWTIAIAIIAIAIVELLRGEIFPKGSYLREALKSVHNSAGTAVFALILLRLVWRSFHKVPGMPETMRPWETFAAKFVHYLLYMLMILIPLSGIIYVFARGEPIDFGMFQITYPLDQLISRDTARTLKGIHGFLGQAILFVAFFHALAGLWHHYIRRDDVLVRMLTSRR